MTNKNLKRIGLMALAALILSASCTNDTPLEPEESPQAFGIRHDKNLDEYEAVARNQSPYNSADHPDFSPVVAFSYSLEAGGEKDFVATGTLIDSLWVITAGHNFYVADKQTEPVPTVAISVLTGPDPNNPTGTYKVDTLVFHPSWFDENDDFVNANDLCLVKLKNPITTVSPAELLSSASEALGSTVWFCGYGDYSNRPGQDPNLLSRRHALQNILDRKAEGIVSRSGGTDYNGGLLAVDFDDPAGFVNTLGDDKTSSDEDLLGSGDSDATATAFEGTTVEGDSGCPLFIQEAGVWKIAGVLSGGVSEPVSGHEDGDYGDISIFIRLSLLLDWIGTETLN